MTVNDDDLQSDNLDEFEQEVEESEVAEPIDDDDEESEDLSDSDSDPDSEPQHEAKKGDELTEFSKGKINERFGKLTRERAEAQRKAQELEKRNQELMEQLLASGKPQVPDLPDPDLLTEREFAEAVKSRDAAMQKQLLWQQQMQQHEHQKQQLAQQKQFEQQQNLERTAQTYQQRAKSLGVKPEELQQAASVVNQVGLNDDIALHILNDEQGALITRYLGNNVQDLLEVASMTPVQAAIYIERQIKPRLMMPKKKSSAAKPPSRVRGGTPDKSDKFPLTGGRVRFE